MLINGLRMEKESVSRLRRWPSVWCESSVSFSRLKQNPLLCDSCLSWLSPLYLFGVRNDESLFRKLKSGCKSEMSDSFTLRVNKSVWKKKSPFCFFFYFGFVFIVTSCFLSITWVQSDVSDVSDVSDGHVTCTLCVWSRKYRDHVSSHLYFVAQPC